jgi:hypothetical protein
MALHRMESDKGRTVLTPPLGAFREVWNAKWPKGKTPQPLFVLVAGYRTIILNDGILNMEPLLRIRTAI